MFNARSVRNCLVNKKLKNLLVQKDYNIWNKNWKQGNPQLSLKFHAFTVLDILVVKKSKLVKDLFVNNKNVSLKI